MATKKLIEVALPLEKINAESAREKSIRHGHPSTLHMWWARRPLAAARAVIWASLVDDPSAHPELFPTEEDQAKERQRLFRILEDLVVWENSNNPMVLEAAKAEIMKSTDNNPPALLDPFAGGGAIPLEAQRLGLEAHAHDLNPVAVMINKAMIEIPPLFSGRSPINPNSNRLVNEGWSGVRGLADDVRYYGEYLKKEVYKRIGHLYPEAEVPKSQGGGKATVIAWIWARTVKCSNPACNCNMPLMSTYSLCKKSGNETWVEPICSSDSPDIEFEVKRGKGKVPESPKVGHGSQFKCIKCGCIIDADYIKAEAVAGRMGQQLVAVVAEGKKGRVYLPADAIQRSAALCSKPEDYPDGALANDTRALYCILYGLDHFSKLFTNRQLTMLCEFTNLLEEIRIKIESDAKSSGLPNDHVRLQDGGNGALAYGEAIITYLAFSIDKMIDYHSTGCVWHTTGEKMANTMRRQGIQMTWDFAECNPFCSSSGCYDNMLDWVAKAITLLPYEKQGIVNQRDAQSDCGLRNIMISTDPPYYDNIGYADLSDYFYIWLRKSLRSVFPSVFSTMLVPKSEELVAIAYRFDGNKEAARDYFEDGMYATLCRVKEYSADQIPVTIYYAFKQNDNEEDSSAASTGWETMLSAIIKAGFTITGTWPMRTEMSTRSRAHGSNALASSIVLVCRKRLESASVCTRRNFINELKRELRPALQKLQSSNIAPVDLAQSAIGPGMGVYSKYSQVLEADGTPMTVRSALKIINQELDLFFNEQDSDLDSESRFCVDLYSQYAFNEMAFGDANTLATAKNTSVAIMASHGTLYAQKGKVHLIERAELPESINSGEQCIWLLCQQLTYRMEKEGVEGCAKAIAEMYGSNAERAKDLAYRLYTIAERKRWAQEGYAYNALVVAWPEIQSRAAELRAIVPQQMTLDDLITE